MVPVGVTAEAISKLGCGEQGDCLSTPADCKEKCGCDKYSCPIQK